MKLIIIFLLLVTSVFPTPITIPKGASSKWIANHLESEGVIDNAMSYYLYIRVKKLGSKMHSGDFDIPKGASFSDITEILTGKKTQFISVTIPEGYTLKEIASTLAEKKIISDPNSFVKYITKDAKQDFLNYEFIRQVPTTNLEGYLFPDTYHLSKNLPYRSIAAIFLKQFNKIVFEEYKKWPTFNLSLHDIITLASIIEKEAATTSEMVTISGVFHNRLKKNMYLSSCPTVGYAMGKPRKKFLTYKDLEYRSPYNTYKNKGLPPTPIAAPGKQAVIAALNPETTPYLYFVSKADGSGTHVFSKTLSQHLKNQKKILSNTTN